MADGSTRRWLLLALLLGLAVRFSHFSAVAVSTIPHWQEVNPEADFEATWTWAAAIRAGDWVGRPPHHPYTRWMRGLGSPADWERWWGGRAIFQQAPLYPYLVAWLAHPPGGSPVGVFALQCLLGALCIPLVYLLARRWGGERAGVAAAFLWALSQPEVALDAFLVRDSLMLPLLLAGLCLLELLRDERPRARDHALLACGAGVTFGLAALDRESALPLSLLLVPVAGWLVRRSRPSCPWGWALGASAAMAVGLALTLSPVIVRNVRMGVAPLTLANRGPEAVLVGLSTEEGADPVFFTIYPALGRDLERAHASTLGAVQVVLQEARERPGRFLRLLAAKAWAWVSATDPGDNVDLAYLTLRSPALRLCIPMVVVMGLGFLGLFRAVREPRRYAVALMALAFLGGPLMLTSVLWRTRVMLLPVVAPLAGVGVAWLAYSFKERRWAPALGATLLLGAYLLLAERFRLDGPYRLRPLEAWMASEVHLSQHQPTLALEDLDEYLGRVARGEAPPSGAVRKRRDQLAAGLLR